jgi:FAD/FMN-containing dehydrogenase
MLQSADLEVAAKELNSRFGGEVVPPGDPRYDEARRVWNAMIDKRPSLVARPRGAADVAAAVDFAREHELPVAVRCGGHSVAGKSAATTGS